MIGRDDGLLRAISLTTEKLNTRQDTRIAIFVDSQAAIIAFKSPNN